MKVKIPQHPAMRAAIVVLILELCGALSLIAGVFSYTQSKVDSQQIVSLNQALDKAAAAQRVQAASAKASTALTEHLLQEINFICADAAARASETGLPPPPAGLCDLVIPTPNP